MAMAYRVDWWGEDETRQKLAARLGHEPHSGIWKLLCDDKWVEDVARGRATIEELATHYRKIKKAFEDNEESSAQKALSPRKLSPSRQMIVVAKVLAQDASADPLVRHFRARYLPELLPPEGVEDWIRRQAERDGLPSDWIEFPAPQGSLSGRDYVGPPLTTLPPGTRVRRKFLEYQTDGDEVRSIPVAAGGVLDRLQEVGESLAGRYGWQESQATLFVLTGQIPLPPSLIYHISAAFGGPGPVVRIVLNVDPEVSPGQVKVVYSKVRRAVLGKRCRPLTEKVIAMVDFVLDHSGLSWQEKWEAWNRACPESRYSSPRSMANAYYRALSKLLGSPLPVFEIPPDG